MTDRSEAVARGIYDAEPLVWGNLSDTFETLLPGDRESLMELADAALAAIVATEPATELLTWLDGRIQAAESDVRFFFGGAGADAAHGRIDAYRAVRKQIIAARKTTP